MAEKHHVVVDGSNLATEGRTAPSLDQLEEAVRSYGQEDPDAEIVVVVDATFGHRIAHEERARFEDAESHGELVSPPAGAIGRGDAFVLRIAERTGATVLSNDSFQEFHAEHPWLFDPGRLVGGKPVPGVGWIFTPRTPVRGPKSRRAVGKAKGEGDEVGDLSPPVKAAEVLRAAKKVAARKAAAPVKKAHKSKPDGAPGAVGAEKAKKAKKAVTPKMAEPPPVAAKKASKKGEAKKVAAKKVAATKVAAKKAAGKKGAPNKALAKTAAKAELVADVVTAANPLASARPAKQVKQVKQVKPAKASGDTAKEAQPGRATLAEVRPMRDRDPRVLKAIHRATTEALTSRRSQAKGKAKAGGKGTKGAKGTAKGAKRRRPGTPPPAVNEPLPFIDFVAAHALSSEVEGEVVSFTSHGAMVDVEVPGGGSLHCYIPLTGLADPPPSKARQILRRAERRTFVLVGLDPPRRMAELALPGVVPSELATNSSSA